MSILFASIKKAAWYYPRSVLATLGFFWLLIEPVIGLRGEPLDLSYWQLFSWSAMFGFVWFVVDGLMVTGFLKRSIEITSNGFDTKIIVKFGNIFRQNGWKAIPVNDFFDSIVDDRHISSRSLHGKLLKKYWAGGIDDWDRQIDEQVSGTSCKSISRASGKAKCYDIGTTAVVTKDREKFLCVALSHTDIESLETKASSSDLHKALRGVLSKARSVCADETLVLPLMGSGLSRVGLKSSILIYLILTAIFEETKISKVTSEIQIILPENKISEINLVSLKKDWT